MHHFAAKDKSVEYDSDGRRHYIERNASMFRSASFDPVAQRSSSSQQPKHQQVDADTTDDESKAHSRTSSTGMFGY